LQGKQSGTGMTFGAAVTELPGKSLQGKQSGTGMTFGAAVTELPGKSLQGKQSGTGMTFGAAAQAAGAIRRMAKRMVLVMK
jgi:hypothetical protein